MKYCNYCGNPINGNESACPHCGGALNAAPQQQFQQTFQQQIPNSYQQTFNPYQQQWNQQDMEADRKATTAKTMGIISFFINPFLIISIIAIVMGNNAAKMASPENYIVQKSAKTAKTCGTISTILYIVVYICYFALFMSFMNG